MLKRLALAAALILGAIAPGLAVGTSASPLPPLNFLMYLSTNTAQASGIVPFDTKTYDTAGVCSTSTHLCTPPAGKYIFGCQVVIASTTGPVVNGNLADARIRINSTDVTDNAVKAQVASLTSPTSTALTGMLFAMNGSDTVGCASVNNGTSPVAASGQSSTYLWGVRVG